MFELTVWRCIETGLVGGEGFAVDASLIQADANRRLAVPGDEGLPPDAAERAVKEYLAVLDDAACSASTPVAPKRLSPGDPEARYSAATPNQAFFSYRTNYLIDLRQRCTPNTSACKIMRSVHEGARDMARDIAQADTYVTSRRQRKKIEMLFAHLTRIPKLNRLRLRGLNGARDEFLLAETAQNLRKIAKLMPVISLQRAI